MAENQEETPAMLTLGSHNYKWTEPSSQETLEWEMASRYIKRLTAKDTQLKRRANWDKTEDGTGRQLMQPVVGVLLQCTFGRDGSKKKF